MEIILAIVSIVVLTFIMSEISSRLHPACSSMDFPSVDDYVAHLDRRDRFFQEEHVGMAAVNTVLTFGVLAIFGMAYPTPALVFAGATFLTWCLLRLCIRRPNQMLRWDRWDRRMLLAALIVGSTAGIFACAALGLTWLTIGGPLVVFMACWLLLFPL